MKNWLEKYKALLILFAYLGCATLVYACLSENNPMTFLMGLFFITFSFFKIIHLKEFYASFKKYDIIAKNINFYAWVYPFIEIVLGLMFLTQTNIPLASAITIIILLSTNIGVIKSLRKGEVLECACLGVVFNLPLSKVTIIENNIMILMAITQLLII
ncbi:hypothetical protein SPBRAN_604 [uncultured Candidatus Thioglobus sp.]|nr:hypothetical protein SPBRAN_604 [uncultured Candidatus Thioglobus sp.]